MPSLKEFKEQQERERQAAAARAAEAAKPKPVAVAKPPVRERIRAYFRKEHVGFSPKGQYQVWSEDLASQWDRDRVKLVKWAKVIVFLAVVGAVGGGLYGDYKKWWRVEDLIKHPKSTIATAIRRAELDRIVREQDAAKKSKMWRRYVERYGD